MKTFLKIKLKYAIVFKRWINYLTFVSVANGPYFPIFPHDKTSFNFQLKVNDKEKKVYLIVIK